MKIAVDIDEVLAELLSSFLEFYKQETGRFVSKDDFFSYNWYEVLGISKEENYKIYDKFVESDFFNELELVPGAVDGVKMLARDNDLIVVTSRHVDSKGKTADWLKRFFGDSFGEICCSCDFHSYKGENLTKVDFCRKLDVDLIIEDNLDYALGCVGVGVRVILLDKPWNQGVDYDNIYRCFSWSEVVDKIEELKDGKVL